MTETTTNTYTVRGMTCDHCRAAVIEEVTEIENVESVDVDVASGRLEVRGTQVADVDVKGAVEEAGYELAAER